jgi:hypothetical protein
MRSFSDLAISRAIIYASSTPFPLKRILKEEQAEAPPISFERAQEQFSILIKTSRYLKMVPVKKDIYTKNEIKIESIEHFLAKASQAERGTLYRGVSSIEYSLLPGLYRNTYIRAMSGPVLFGINEIERKMLHRFIDALNPNDIPVNIDNDWDRLVLAQHFRMYTRLLDWTLNPLVALYFAVADYSQYSVKGSHISFCVYQLTPPREWYQVGDAYELLDTERKNVSYFSPFDNAKVDQPTIVYPKNISSRIINQSSVLIAHNEYSLSIYESEFCKRYVFTNKLEEQGDKVNEVHGDKVSYNGSRFDQDRTRYMTELFKLGIHSGLLFPDLEGYAKKINEYFTAECYQRFHKT